ncbi:related to heat shock transcription factor [Cephalotrichum gorgonifer]|uniref:Related to heat shock transcription factor n=1 Tax=Cephalotrichum gorgonifer TaxID=2041049 RepID=A0AAE8N1T8_9PEZI|nr:related to heat shock transcription factor [Cephalotrichum gorgonifer]
MTSPNQRKRPAPGASPSIPMHSVDQQFAGTDHLVRWNSPDNSNGYVDDDAQTIGSFGITQPPAKFAQPQVPAAASTMLARRQMNRALVPTGARGNFEGDSDPWSSLVPADTAVLDPTVGGMNEQDNLVQLEQLALKAKREAEAKRKQIPPFVQKLSSFLNEGKNQDLIRWSEKGDSFIVVDEEEFAKKLIPELFKHNNYASFVRQLNMYGFHKRVGLSDNSMRASERKNKSPSEYSNPYFRRGHPNLLWLITKPKGNSKAKKPNKNPDQDVDSEEDAGADEAQPYATVQGGMSLSEVGASKKDISVFRDEFKKIREHQQVILSRMQRLEQNQQRIEQQQRAQQQKDQRVDEIYRLFMRHENSLQNMMQILVYHFKKTLEDGKSAQQIKDIMASGFLPGGSHSSSHGIVELDDLANPQPKSPGPVGTGRRAPRLLEAPPSVGNTGSVHTLSPSPTPGYSAGPEMGTVTEILENTPVDASGSAYDLGPDLDTKQQENLLRLLHDANKDAAAVNALSRMGTGDQSTMPNPHPNIPTNPVPQAAGNPRPSGMGQREEVHRPMSSGGNPSAVPASIPAQNYFAASSAAAPPAPSASTSMPSGVNPTASAASDMSHFPPAPHSIPRGLEDITYNSKEFEHLKKLQAAQDANIQLLGSKIAPLSPLGQISGASPDGGDYFQGGNFDLNDPTFNEFINSDPFSNEGDATGGDQPNYDFDLSLLGMPNAASPNVTEDVQNGEAGAKRRRVQ